MKDLENILRNFSIAGIADISDMDIYNNKYNRAISVGIGYSQYLREYNPIEFKKFLLGEIRYKLEKNLIELTEFLGKNNIEYKVIGNIQVDKKNSIAEFSHKFAAVRAGLGWIGKNGLLVTEKFGPRVRLETILVNIDIEPSTLKKFIGCGDCDECVRLCPSKVLKGADTRITMNREDIIDIYNCKDKNERREEYICALGLVGCPIGRLDLK